MEDNVNVVDRIGIVNMEKTFGYLKLPLVSRHFRMDKEDLLSMVEIVDNMSMVDSKYT